LFKKLFITGILLINAFFTKAQSPLFNSNTSEKDKEESIIYKNFHNQCDFIMAYSVSSYWRGNTAQYNLLALKDGVWLKGYLHTQKRKNNTWRKPLVVFKEVDPDSASYIMKYLDSAGFYSLNRDSLNISERRVNDDNIQRITISDAINYKFEILSRNDFLVIESYAPEFFFEKMPEIKSRGAFIKLRDWFLLKYKVLPIQQP